MATWALGGTAEGGRTRHLSQVEAGAPPARRQRQEGAGAAEDDDEMQTRAAKGKSKGKGKLRAEGRRLAALEELVVAMANL